MHASRRGSRGVSLIEALVALAVMSFGMLAVVGVQATLRFNADIAKQRSEAVRIGQEVLEAWRAYSQIDTDPGGLRRAYADIATRGVEPVNGITTNTVYRIERTVTESASQGSKAVRVTVSWQDRNGTTQSIRLDTQIARNEPALTATIVQAGSTQSPLSRPLGRHAAIPLTAKDLGDGSSVFKLPGSVAAPSVTAWVFNNTTGFITGVCTVAAGQTSASLTAVDIASCRDNTLAQLLSGYVRFSTGASQPTAADAETPTGTARNLDISLTLGDARVPSCFDDAPTTSTAAATQTAVSYACAIPANDARTWAGYSTILPLPFTDQPDSAWAIPAKGLPADVPVGYKLCRYTPATSDAQVVPNSQHPYQYRIEYADGTRRSQALPMPPLVNQNFLVIRSAFNCPTDVPAGTVPGDFVNSNTLVHVPLP